MNELSKKEIKDFYLAIYGSIYEVKEQDHIYEDIYAYTLWYFDYPECTDYTNFVFDLVYKMLKDACKNKKISMSNVLNFVKKMNIYNKVNNREIMNFPAIGREWPACEKSSEYIADNWKIAVDWTFDEDNIK